MSKANLKARDLLAQSAKDDIFAASLGGYGDCGAARAENDSFVDRQARGNRGASTRIFISLCGEQGEIKNAQKLFSEYEIWLDSAVCAGDEQYKKEFINSLETCDGAVFVTDGKGGNLSFILNFAIQHAWEQRIPFFVVAGGESASAIKQQFSSVPVISSVGEAVFDASRGVSRGEDAVGELFSKAYSALKDGKTDDVCRLCGEIKQVSAQTAGKVGVFRRVLADALCAEAYVGEGKYADAAKFLENAASVQTLRSAAVLRREAGSRREAAGDLEKAIEKSGSGGDAVFDLVMLSEIYRSIGGEDKANTFRERAKKIEGKSRLASAWISGNSKKIEKDKLENVPQLVRAARLYENDHMTADAVQCLQKALMLSEKSGDSKTAALCCRRLRDISLIDGCAKALAHSKKACSFDEKCLCECESKENSAALANDLLITGLLGGGADCFKKAADAWQKADDRQMGEAALRLSNSAAKRHTRSFEKESKRRRFEKWVRDLGKLRIPLLLLAIVVGIAALAGVTCGVKEVHEIIVEAKTRTTTGPQFFNTAGYWKEYDRLEVYIDASNLEFEWRFKVESEGKVTLDWGDGKTSTLKPGTNHVRQKMTSTHIDIYAEEDVVITFDDGTKYDSSPLRRPEKPTEKTTTTRKTARRTTAATTTAAAQITYKISNVKVYQDGALTGYGISQGTVTVVPGGSASVSVGGIPIVDENGNPTGETESVSFSFTPSGNGNVSASSSSASGKQFTAEFTITKTDE